MDEGQPIEPKEVEVNGLRISPHMTRNEAAEGPFPDDIDDDEGGEDNRSGILAEDFILEEELESEYWRIKNDNHETVKRQTRWINRCKCAHKCD